MPSRRRGFPFSKAGNFRTFRLVARGLHPAALGTYTLRMHANKKAPQKKAAVKKTARKANKPGATAAKVSRRTKQVARGAQKVGAVLGTIGEMVRKGGEAAEDMVLKVEAGKKRTSSAGTTARKSTKRVRKSSG